VISPWSTRPQAKRPTIGTVYGAREDWSEQLHIAVTMCCTKNVNENDLQHVPAAI
jgi:hypothetical protein